MDLSFSELVRPGLWRPINLHLVKIRFSFRKESQGVVGKISPERYIGCQEAESIFLVYRERHPTLSIRFIVDC